MRLIDADSLKAAVPEVEPDSYEDCDNCDMMGEIAVRDLIDAAPTVDAVPVVRCRECRYYKNHPNGLCYLHTEPSSSKDGIKGDVACVNSDDFCSYGQRKDQSADVRKKEEESDHE